MVSEAYFRHATIFIFKLRIVWNHLKKNNLINFKWIILKNFWKSNWRETNEYEPIFHLFFTYIFHYSKQHRLKHKELKPWNTYAFRRLNSSIRCELHAKMLMFAKRDPLFPPSTFFFFCLNFNCYIFQSFFSSEYHTRPWIYLIKSINVNKDVFFTYH